MNRDPGERRRLKALVAGERASADAPTFVQGSPLDGPALEKAIVQALRRRGGRARRSEVLAALSDEFHGRFDPLDLEALPSGMVRWEAQAGKARQRMVQRGALLGNSPRGVWELREWDRHG